MNGREAEEYLEALGSILERESEEPLGIMVCGGMALILQGLLDRRTRDIDKFSNNRYWGLCGNLLFLLLL